MLMARFRVLAGDRAQACNGAPMKSVLGLVRAAIEGRLVITLSRVLGIPRYG
jgi:hypothetical protein